MNQHLFYIGSTCQDLQKRFCQHKIAYKNPYNNLKQYSKMRETDVNDWYIELFENVICDNKDQLNKREGQEIREIGT